MLLPPGQTRGFSQVRVMFLLVALDSPAKCRQPAGRADEGDAWCFPFAYWSQKLGRLICYP